MQKFLCLAIVVLSVVNNVQSDMTEETEQFFATIDSCKNETGASDADVEEFYNRQIPTNETAMCLNNCVLEKLKIIVNGTLSQDGLIKAVEMEKFDLKGKDGRSLLESTKDIYGACTAVTDPNKCKYAAKARICLNAKAKELGMCPNVF